MASQKKVTAQQIEQIGRLKAAGDSDASIAEAVGISERSLRRYDRDDVVGAKIREATARHAQAGPLDGLVAHLSETLQQLSGRLRETHDAQMLGQAIQLLGELRRLTALHTRLSPRAQPASAKEQPGPTVDYDDDYTGALQKIAVDAWIEGFHGPLYEHGPVAAGLAVLTPEAKQRLYVAFGLAVKEAVRLAEEGGFLVKDYETVIERFRAQRKEPTEAQEENDAAR